MTPRRAACWGILLALCACSTADAAVSSLALDTGFEAARPGTERLGAWLGPAFLMEGSSASLSLEGRLGAGSGLWAPQRAGRLRLNAMLREQGRLRPELVVAADVARGSGGARQGLRLHLAGARAGTWVSASAEGASFDGERPSLRVPLLGFGAWARTQRWMLMGAVEQHLGSVRLARQEPSEPDTQRGAVGVGDMVKPTLRTSPEQVMLSTAYASLQWDADRFELQSIGGVTVGPHAMPSRWAQASLAWRLTSQLALVAAAGSRSPQYLSLDAMGERHAALSLRFSQATSRAAHATIVSRAESRDCVVRPMGEGVWRVEIRAPGARVVELQSDATGWQPVTLQPAGGGRWEVELRLAPGVHQVGLRVDGGPWLPPPGLPTSPDGFGGSVGVIVIE